MDKEKHAAGAGDGVPNYKVKLMCSYGGKIHPRPSDRQLTYIGGDTKILNVDRNIKFSNMIIKLHSLCDSNFPFRLKYQLPGYDLDALVSVIDEVDLENMMFEYDRLLRNSIKPVRFRMFVFFSDVRPATTPDFLFGFDKEYSTSVAAAAAGTTLTQPNLEASKNSENVSGENNVNSDPINGADILKTKQIQVIEAVLPTYSSRDNNVTPGGFTYGAPVYYRVPVPASTGYYQVGPYGGMHRLVGNGEQPVYTYVPVFPSGNEQVTLTNSYLPVSKQSDGFVAVGGGGGGTSQPAVTSVAVSAVASTTTASAVSTTTSNHQTEVSQQA